MKINTKIKVIYGTLDIRSKYLGEQNTWAQLCS